MALTTTVTSHETIDKFQDIFRDFKRRFYLARKILINKQFIYIGVKPSKTHLRELDVHMFYMKDQATSEIFGSLKKLVDDRRKYEANVDKQLKEILHGNS